MDHQGFFVGQCCSTGDTERWIPTPQELGSNPAVNRFDEANPPPSLHLIAKFIDAAPSSSPFCIRRRCDPFGRWQKHEKGRDLKEVVVVASTAGREKISTRKKVDSKKSFLQWPWRHLASPLSQEGINIKSVNKISRAKILWRIFEYKMWEKGTFEISSFLIFQWLECVWKPRPVTMD